MFFGAMRVNINGVTDELVSSAGVDPIQDAMRRGYIRALEDVLMTDFSEE